MKKKTHKSHTIIQLKTVAKYILHDLGWMIRHPIKAFKGERPTHNSKIPVLKQFKVLGHLDISTLLLNGKLNPNIYLVYDVKDIDGYTIIDRTEDGYSIIFHKTQPRAAIVYGKVLGVKRYLFHTVISIGEYFTSSLSKPFLRQYKTPGATSLESIKLIVSNRFKHSIIYETIEFAMTVPSVKGILISIVLIPIMALLMLMLKIGETLAQKEFEPDSEIKTYSIEEIHNLKVNLATLELEEKESSLSGSVA